MFYGFMEENVIAEQCQNSNTPSTKWLNSLFRKVRHCKIVCVGKIVIRLHTESKQEVVGLQRTRLKNPQTDEYQNNLP